MYVCMCVCVYKVTIHVCMCVCVCVCVCVCIQQVYETQVEDAIYCNTHKISFLRATFGTCDDLIDVPIIKVLSLLLSLLALVQMNKC
jgi:hypothetical protein